MKRSLVQKFPMLREFEAKRRIEDVDYIEIADFSEILDYTPRCNGATGDLIGILEKEEIHFVYEDAIKKNCAKTTGTLIHNEPHIDNEFWAGETVLEVLMREGYENLKYIIKEANGYKIRNHHSIGGWGFTIYKPATSVSELIAEAKAKAIASLNAAPFWSKIDPNGLRGINIFSCDYYPLGWEWIDYKTTEIAREVFESGVYADYGDASSTKVAIHRACTVIPRTCTPKQAQELKEYVTEAVTRKSLGR